MVRCDGMFPLFVLIHCTHVVALTSFVECVIFFRTARMKGDVKCKEKDREFKVKKHKTSAHTRKDETERKKVRNIDARNVFYVMQLCVSSKRD